jgi:DNA polymerase III epsilon subunit-like protein
MNSRWLRSTGEAAEVIDKFGLALEYDREAGRVVVYNAEFDERLLNQTALAWGLEPGWGQVGFECAKLEYAEYIGEPGKYNGYRWHKLVDAAAGYGVDVAGAHRAEADCLLTLGVIKGLAGVGQ